MTLEARHIRGLKIKDEDLEETDSNKWSIKSQTDESIIYVVEKVKDECQEGDCSQMYVKNLKNLNKYY